MNRTAWLTTFLTTISLLTAAQEPAPPTPAPRPTQDAPAPVLDVEIVEPADPAPTPGAPEVAEGPAPRREIRIIDGDTEIWVDEGGDVHELGEVMGQALEFNPELRAIRAEIQALMARLEQLEMKTATDVVRKKVELKSLVDKQKLLKSKDFEAPELKLLDADIAAKKMELDYIVGAPGAPRDERMRVMRIGRDDTLMIAPLAMLRGEPRPEMDSLKDERLKKTLGVPIEITFEDVKLHEVIDFIAEIYELNFNVDVTARNLSLESINLKNVPLRAALAALADSIPELAFVFREYGIFVTTKDRAISIPGPSIPEGVPYSPRASATPKPAPMAFGLPGEPGFKDRGNPFERRKSDQDQSPKVSDYVEGKQDVKPAPAPTPKPSN